MAQAELPEEVRAALSRASTATITTRLLTRGFRNTFLHGLEPLGTYGHNLVGPAFTLRYIPAREDIDVIEAFQDYDHPQRAAIEQAPEGSVLVMDCRGVDRAASIGHILATRLARRGVAGLVTDGSVRDAAPIAALPMPVFLRSRSAMTNLALHHAVESNVPIGCAGVPVYPGDVIVGDTDGVVCIPRHVVAEIAEEAAAQEEFEQFITRQIENGAPLRGTYPPDQAMRDRFEAERQPRDQTE